MSEQQMMKNTKMEHSMSMIMKESNMKYGWYQMINNVVHYYQTTYNIALIVE